MLLHASCASRASDAVLLLGPPGSGKSDLVLRLLGRGWGLVADDQVDLAEAGGRLLASPPPALAGMVELRGLGIFRDLPLAPLPAALRLVVQLAERLDIPRLPRPQRWACLGVTLPLISLHAFDASAPERLAWALDAALGLAVQQAGAFAA